RDGVRHGDGGPAGRRRADPGRLPDGQADRHPSDPLRHRADRRRGDRPLPAPDGRGAPDGDPLRAGLCRPSLRALLALPHRAVRRPAPPHRVPGDHARAAPARRPHPVTARVHGEIETYARELGWILDQGCAALDGLTAAQLTWRPATEASNSLAAVAGHVLGARACTRSGSGAAGRSSATGPRSLPSPAPTPSPSSPPYSSSRVRSAWRLPRSDPRSSTGGSCRRKRPGARARRTRSPAVTPRWRASHTPPSIWASSG